MRELAAIAATLVVTSTAVTALAQNTVSADRPTFSAAAATVDAGRGQLEIGGELAVDDAASISLPALLRLGVAQSLEVRFGLPALIAVLDGGSVSLSGVQVGAKAADEVSEQLSLGAMPFVDIPLGQGESGTFSRSNFGFAGLWGFSIVEMFSTRA